MTHNEYVVMCLESLQQDTNNDNGLLIFPYDGVCFTVVNSIVKWCNQKYLTYRLDQLKGSTFYYAYKDFYGNITIKVGKLSSKAA